MNMNTQIKEQDIALGIIVITKGPNAGSIGLIVNV